MPIDRTLGDRRQRRAGRPLGQGRAAWRSRTPRTTSLTRSSPNALSSGAHGLARGTPVRRATHGGVDTSLAAKSALPRRPSTFAAGDTVDARDRAMAGVLTDDPDRAGRSASWQPATRNGPEACRGLAAGSGDRVDVRAVAATQSKPIFLTKPARREPTESFHHQDRKREDSSRASPSPAVDAEPSGLPTCATPHRRHRGRHRRAADAR